MTDISEEDRKMIDILRASVYPANNDADIVKVIRYCEEANIDPMANYVNIVPVSLRDGKQEDGRPNYRRVNVVRPGIGYFRQAAHRTGEYLGYEAPEFGEDKILEYGKTAKDSIAYPEYICLTVRRIVGAHVATFPTIVYFLETYATKSNFVIEPNAMWKKRPRGQLLKCAEALALRTAFADRFSGVASAEEIADKVIAESELAQTGRALNQSEVLRDNVEAAKQHVKEQQDAPKPESKQNGPSIDPQTLENRIRRIQQGGEATKTNMRQIKEHINKLAQSDEPAAKMINLLWKKKAVELGFMDSKEKSK